LEVSILFCGCEIFLCLGIFSSHSLLREAMIELSSEQFVMARCETLEIIEDWNDGMRKELQDIYNRKRLV
jgi:hypothetical protein